jgi:hypothetical protein
MCYLESDIWHLASESPVVVPVCESLIWASRPPKARPGVARQEGVIGISTCHPCSCACASLTGEGEKHRATVEAEGQTRPDLILHLLQYNQSFLDSWFLSWTGPISFSQKGSPVFLLFQDHDTLASSFISNNVVPIRNYYSCSGSEYELACYKSK